MQSDEFLYATVLFGLTASDIFIDPALLYERSEPKTGQAFLHQ